MFLVVLVLSVGFLALYRLGTTVAFDAVDLGEARGQLDDRVLTGSTLFGLAMFTTLFLGAVLAFFLTLGVVRGDAERGLLQPLVVRPVGRTCLLLGRFAGAGLVCALYVAAVYGVRVVITGLTGEWWPDSVVRRARARARRAGDRRASLLGSIFLTATANGIGVFMLFGAGLAAGPAGPDRRRALCQTLEGRREASAWLLPFEALYQAGLEASRRTSAA